MRHEKEHSVQQPNLEEFRSLRVLFQLSPDGLKQALSEQGHVNDLARSRSLLMNLHKKICKGIESGAINAETAKKFAKTYKDFASQIDPDSTKSAGRTRRVILSQANAIDQAVNRLLPESEQIAAKAFKRLHSDGSTTTCYNADYFKPYLTQKLDEIAARVNLEKPVNFWTQRENPHVFIATIHFDNPKIVDWMKERLDGGLFISSNAGGCFLRPPIVNCRTIPSVTNSVGVFVFSFELSTHYTPEIDHTIDSIKTAIDTFVKRAKVGLCNHFGGELINK
jgi:hypothetical protein